MANENGARSFPQDIFAEDNDNWQWGSVGSNSKTSTTAPTYGHGVIPGIARFDSSRSSSSEGDLAYPSDSNSQRRIFRKRGSSTGSEENLPEGVCYSPSLQKSLPRERPPPSIYDDDAQSGSPGGNYEHKNLAFIPSFHNEFGTTAANNKETSPLHSAALGTKDKMYERDIIHSDEMKHDALRTDGLSKNFPANASRISVERRKSEKSRSRSPSSSHYRSPSRSQSRCKEPRAGSPHKEGHFSSTRRLESGSRDRSRPMRGRRSRSPVSRPRSRSRDSHRRSRSKDSRKRSRSRDSHRRSRSRDSHKRSRSRDARKRSRSRETRRRSRSKDTRRSRSRDTRRSRSRDPHKRSRSRDSRKRRSRSRSYERRRRYRSPSRDRYRRRRHSRSRSRSRDRSKGRSGSSHRKPGSLPLSSSGGTMTPQMALQQTMAAMSAKAQAMTGIALPKYYNPAAVNPLKYAEQVQKRKLLWQTKDKVEEQPKNSVWDKLKFAQDQDGKMTAKFRKLMGIKSEGSEPKAEEEKESVLKKQEELFRDLDQQYEMARMTTHTQRGVGLGYSAQPLYPPVPK